ncbi:hypothetical protein FRB93_009811 [Tulasnella sp. JGI-2019a]|nr:hypothetical protein FRB93_009811 [Tulasnella sp. JGI-2019a]
MQCLRELCLLRPYSTYFDPDLSTLLAKGTLHRLFIYGVSIYHQFSAADSLEDGTLDLFVIAFPRVPLEVVAKGSSGHNNINRGLGVTKRLPAFLVGGAPKRSSESMAELVWFLGVDGVHGRTELHVALSDHASIL